MRAYNRNRRQAFDSERHFACAFPFQLWIRKLGCAGRSCAAEAHLAPWGSEGLLPRPVALVGARVAWRTPDDAPPVNSALGERLVRASQEPRGCLGAAARTAAALEVVAMGTPND